MKKFNYFKAGLGKYIYRMNYLDLRDFLNLKEKGSLVSIIEEEQVLQTIKGYETSKIYRLNENEVITYDEDVCEIQIFPTFDDYKNFIFFEQNREVLEKPGKKYNERSFCNGKFEIIDYVEYDIDSFLERFSMTEIELPEAVIFEKENNFCYKLSDRICSLNSNDDLQQFKKHINQPVFANTHPYGKDLFLHREKLYETLMSKIGIQLDFSIESLALIDKEFDTISFTEHFFYEIYASIFLYFGDCLVKNNPTRFSWLDNFTDGFYTPVIKDKKFDLEKSLDILIYENFINENKVILSLVHLYDFFNREKANCLF